MDAMHYIAHQHYRMVPVHQYAWTFTYKHLINWLTESSVNILTWILWYSRKSKAGKVWKWTERVTCNIGLMLLTQSSQKTGPWIQNCYCLWYKQTQKLLSGNMKYTIMFYWFWSMEVFLLSRPFLLLKPFIQHNFPWTAIAPINKKIAPSPGYLAVKCVGHIFSWINWSEVFHNIKSLHLAMGKQKKVEWNTLQNIDRLSIKGP